MKAPLFLTLFTLSAATSASNAAVLQTIAGPDTATGGGVGNVIVDTSSDTGDWIDTLNAGSTVFVGFDWTITNNAGETGAGGFFGGLGVYNGAGERLLIGNGWPQLTYSGGASGTIEDTGIAYTLNTTVRIVAELTTTNDGSGNDTWRMWVDPSTGDLGSPDAERTDWTIDDLTQLTHRAGNSPASTTMSNVVIADDFSSAVSVPEPSSAALVGLGGMAFILRRRK
ncbi:MAG: PEP-CTERM sorting domain-containing protein [Akkermansiaceae bacterium]